MLLRRGQLWHVVHPWLLTYPEASCWRLVSYIRYYDDTTVERSQVVEGDALDGAAVRQSMQGHSIAINAAGHVDDGQGFHRLFKGMLASWGTLASAKLLSSHSVILLLAKVLY